MKNIVLTGFMGSGKSSVGKRIAKRLGMKVVDTDDLIEERMCMSINDIFAEHGEPYFREVEKNVVREVSDLDNRVIVTGGGVVLDKENIRSLGVKGVIVYLHVTPEEAYERVRHRTHRPLLNVDDPLGKIRELLEYREPFYADNDVEVNTTGMGVSEVADEVLMRVEPMISG
ncbi:MAG: shikimate kinase [Candidatus Hydrothermarchaeaceae archaeon]